MNREQTQEVEEKELERTSSISEWAERIRGNWNNVELWSWEEILTWMLEQGFRLPEEDVRKPEPTPTEMVRKLLENGWEVSEKDCYIILSNPRKDRVAIYSVFGLRSAYHCAFPPKKKIEVEVWRHKDGTVSTAENIGDEYGRPSTSDGLLKPGWTKGTATFWVEDSDD